VANTAADQSAISDEDFASLKSKFPKFPKVTKGTLGNILKFCVLATVSFFFPLIERKYLRPGKVILKMCSSAKTDKVLRAHLSGNVSLHISLLLLTILHVSFFGE